MEQKETKNEVKKGTFKILSMDKVLAKSKKVKPTIDSKRKDTTKKVKYTFLEEKYKDVIPIHEFYTKEGSVQDFLDECHPDVRNFIETNRPSKYIAETGRLLVVTQNRFRIEIKITGKYTRQVVIKDNRRKIIYNGESVVILPKDQKNFKYT